jgi:UDP-2-acetamido-3-amino-2,3-dideoxy-glucuronate N-acetyltransferase
MTTRYFKHESAYVDDGAEIGDGSKIWHYTHIASGARLGRDCVLGQNVYVAPTAVLGDGVRVQNNVSIYDGVVLLDHVFVGPSAVFTNVVNPRAEISRKHEYRKTTVGRGATIGANATIVCGHDIGRYAFIGAGAVVTKSVADYQLWLGVPAQLAGYVCRCGERLHMSEGAGATRCAACQAAYSREGDLLCPV